MAAASDAAAWIETEHSRRVPLKARSGSLT